MSHLYPPGHYGKTLNGFIDELIERGIYSTRGEPFHGTMGKLVCIMQGNWGPVYATFRADSIERRVARVGNSGVRVKDQYILRWTDFRDLRANPISSYRKAMEHEIEPHTSYRVKKLQAAGFFCDHDITSSRNPMIALATGRVCGGGKSEWRVTIKDREMPWQKEDGEVFSYYACAGPSERGIQLDRAKGWIQSHFNGLEMIASPFGRFSYVPKEDLDAAMLVADKDAP